MNDHLASSDPSSSCHNLKFESALETKLLSSLHLEIRFDITDCFSNDFFQLPLKFQGSAFVRFVQNV